MQELLASDLTLGAALARLRDAGGYELVEHHQQGEFHHDVVIRATSLPGAPYFVIATNCNGGVKEVLRFSEQPAPWALWKWRCPESTEFEGELPEIEGVARTHHYFDPCELLRADARSEYRREHRERAPGGGWRKKGCG